MTSRFSSHAIARQAGLTLVPVRQRGAVREQGLWLYLGPGACDDTIVTVSCRRMVLREHLTVDEARVREKVRSFGYRYVSPTKTHPKSLVSVRSDRSVESIKKRRSATR